MANAADFGEKWRAWLMKFDHDSCSWKTRQPSLFEDLSESLETLPRWGLMLDGECFPDDMLEPPTQESACGWWPTPMSGPCCRSQTVESTLRLIHRDAVSQETTMTAVMRAAIQQSLQYPPRGNLNPLWIEWLMGWCIGWTDLQPLEMDKFQQWRQQHGECLTCGEAANA